MYRRNFLKKGLLGVTGALIAKDMVFAQKFPTKPIASRILNAYYFRAHMYTLVPRHVKEDLKWMADCGTNTVSISILEQDLYAAVENVNIICNEAEKLGIQVFAVPSRWGGMVAGAPKVPSMFAIENPQTWMLNDKGKARYGPGGAICSVHYPETLAFFCNSIDKMLHLWPIKGIIWDEPKNISISTDYSIKAIETLGENAPFIKHVEASRGFFSKVNTFIKSKNPNVSTSLFLYADMEEKLIATMADTENLDYFGCDGRPWNDTDGGVPENGVNAKVPKVLLGPGENFLPIAKQKGKKTLWLIENHNMIMKDAELMDKRMPEILAKNIDHLIYYYYPRNLQDPDKIMSIVSKHLKNYIY